MKRLLLMICSLSLLILTLYLLPEYGSALTEGDYTYIVNNGTATITDYPTTVAGTLIIPNTLGGYPVTAIGNFAFKECVISGVIIPDGVTSIGNYAFENCTALRFAEIPEGVSSLGWSVFRCCGSLSSVTLPDSLTSIGTFAFYDCGSLTSFTFPKNLTIIGNSAFNYCDGLTELNIPESVTTIGNHAFGYCNGLTSVFIPKNVTSIGTSIFMDCDNLTGIWVDENNTAYSNDDYGVLYDKNKTKLISAPALLSGSHIMASTVTQISDYAYYNVSKLTTLCIPKGVTSIGEYAFSYCSPKQIFYEGTEENRSACVLKSHFTKAQWYYEVETLADGGGYRDGKTGQLFNADFTAVPLAGLTVTRLPDLTRYYTGGNLHLTGITLEGVYADGSIATFSQEYIQSVSADLSTVGKKAVTVQIAGATAQFDIFVHHGQSGTKIDQDPTVYPFRQAAGEYGPYFYRYFYPGALSITFTVTGMSADKLTFRNGLNQKIVDLTAVYSGVTVTVPGDTAYIYVTTYGGGWDYFDSFDLGSLIVDMGAEIHNPSSVGTVVAPTCSEQGYTLRNCTICDLAIKDSFVDTIDHSYGSWRLTQAPSCTTEGMLCRNCSVCQAADYQTIAPSGHSFETVVTSPSCTEDGSESSTCTVCGTVESNVIPATGHSFDDVKVQPTCTVGGYTQRTCETCGYYYLDNYTPSTGHNFGQWQLATFPTCNQNGSMERICSDCSFTESDFIEASGHAFTNGICTTCGSSQVITPTITPKYPSLSFESEVYMSVYFTVSDMTDVIELGLVVSDDASVDENDAVINEYGYKTGTNLFAVRTHGIPAKELGKVLYFKIYAKLCDGSYVYSGVYNYSAVAYAQDRLSNSSDEGLKKLCVAMLNYGAAAQNYMNYQTDALANAGLTAEQLALVEDYRSDMVAAIAGMDSKKVKHFVFNGYSQRIPSVSFDGAFGISYYFTPSHTPDNGITLYYWDAEAYAATDSLLPSNATGVLTTDGSGTNAYKATVQDIAAKEMDSVIYVCALYVSSGETYCTGVLPYSLGAYCQDRIAKGSDAMKALATATAVYGYYAKQHFLT